MLIDLSILFAAVCCCVCNWTNWTYSIHSMPVLCTKSKF